MANQPQAIPSAWAANNSTTNSIPATTTESGKASWDQGFPVETSLPLSAGGIPPKYGDFNGVLKVLSQFCLFAQDGGQFAYDVTVDYTAGALVQGSDNALYECLIANGPGSTVVNPVGDTSGKWGRLATESDLAGYALDSAVVKLAGAQTITGSKTFSSDILTTANIAGNSSNFIIKNTTIASDGETGVQGGNGYANGAYLVLYGASHANCPGQFRLNTTNGNKRLIGDTDGTLSWDGNIKLISSASTSIMRDDNTGKTWVCGGKSATYSDGAHLTVCGVDQTTDPGAFFLVAGNSSGAKELAGYPDGTMIWDGSLKLEKGNPYLWFVETDWVKGTAPSATTYQGIVFRDKEEHDGAAIYYHYYSNKTSEIEVRVSKLNASTDTAWAGIYINYKADGATSLYPGQNTWLLGENTSSRKWKEIWCAQSSINSSSDEREKQQIATIPDEVLDAWAEVQWSQFKWNDSVKEKGETARLHTGLIAQRIASVFSAHNLDAASYGLFLHDTWDAEPARTDDKGNPITEPIPAGDAYGLRYTEALAMEAAYQRRRADRAEARISALEQRLGELEAVLASLISPVNDEQTIEPEMEGE